MCKHFECPYKYYPFHKYYDSELEIMLDFVIPDNFDDVEDCISYLDS